jgi:16S rRNA (uracil1498-N3)-methyltransferase
MRRYWVEEDDIQGETVIFRGETFHHVVEVCRQEPPARFEVLAPSGRAFFVEMSQLHRSKRDAWAEARILEAREIPKLQKPYIHLVLAVGRFPVLESVLEKAVELGVHSVHLAFSEFSFVKSDEKISESRFTRWQKIIRGATQQTGRGELMTLQPPRALGDIVRDSHVNRESKHLGLFMYEGEGKTLSEWVKLQSPLSQQEAIWVFVGAEGGFSKKEVELFAKHGLDPLSLGSQVLRVETACVSVVSVLKYLIGISG